MLVTIADGPPQNKESPSSSTFFLTQSKKNRSEMFNPNETDRKWSSRYGSRSRLTFFQLPIIHLVHFSSRFVFQQHSQCMMMWSHVGTKFFKRCPLDAVKSRGLSRRSWIVEIRKNLPCITYFDLTV